jgi:hypothetical protein
MDVEVWRKVPETTIRRFRALRLRQKAGRRVSGGALRTEATIFSVLVREASALEAVTRQILQELPVERVRFPTGEVAVVGGGHF